jgi:hypothetical protein
VEQQLEQQQRPGGTAQEQIELHNQSWAVGMHAAPTQAMPPRTPSWALVQECHTALVCRCRFHV